MCLFDYLIDIYSLGGGPPTFPEAGQGGAPSPTPTKPPPPKPKDEACHPNPCQNGGTCRANRSGGYKCLCPVGFTGSHCQGNFSSLFYATKPKDLLLQQLQNNYKIPNHVLKQIKSLYFLMQEIIRCYIKGVIHILHHTSLAVLDIHPSPVKLHHKVKTTKSPPVCDVTL